MNLFLIGDIIGEPGREACARLLPDLRRDLKLDFVMANVENLAHGFGVTPKTLQELARCGVDVFSSGNHVWDNKEWPAAFQSFPNLLRPANYPEGAPGKGHHIFQAAGGGRVGVINLQGRSFMLPIDDPFRLSRQLAGALKGQGLKVLVVDFHAEATAEKVALAAWLDGEVSVCAGTHTHIPTADARISPQGTAAITDLGMTGPYDSVIGMKKEIIFQKFLLQTKIKYEVAGGDVQLWGLLVEVDEATGKALRVEQVRRRLQA